MGKLKLLLARTAMVCIGAGSTFAQTKTAVSAGPLAEFPQLTEGGFEEPTITGFSFLPFWRSWSLDNAGIAANGSTITAFNQNAPEGARVAFLQGASSIKCQFQLPSGTWRIRFQGAQRTNGTTIDQQTLRVMIGSTTVFQQAIPNSDYEEFSTRPVTLASSTLLVVRFEGMDTIAPGQTVLIDRIQLEPIAPWTSTSTWGGTPPSSTDTVLVPSGVEVALAGAALATSVDVQGELLLTNANASLDTEAVTIDGATARFEVGLPEVPYTGEFALTLLGAPAPGTNTKRLLALNGGTIDMHGVPRDFDAGGGGRRRSWTRLASDAAAGSSSIVVSESVSWRPGDRLVIAGTQFLDPNGSLQQWSEAEEVQILSVGASGVDITLTSALAFDHIGSALPSVSSGSRTWNIDERAEVGLLTHNIKVQGDATSDNTRWGAHVMIMRSGPINTGGVGRFSSVEFFRVGQQKELGRYPIHWHMQLDQGEGQYARSCSIHRSYNRAITIHGTEHVLLEGNVAYDHLGHGIFLEDGSERFNKIYYNLALHTVRPLPGEALLPSDFDFATLQNRSPSTYWITNPNNEFVGNVAGGTVGTGFWFALPTAPLGLSAAQSYFSGLQPDREPLGLFVDNVCHSSGTGLDIHDSIDPTTHGIVANHPWYPTSAGTQTLTRFSAYGCGVAIYGGAGSRDRPVEHDDALLCDNGTNIAFAGFDVARNSCVVARSGSQVYPPLTFAYLVYDGPGRVFDTHFAGFNGVAETFFSHIGAASRNVNHRIRNLTFDPSGFPTMGLGNFGLSDDPSLMGVVFVCELSPGVFVGSLVNDHPMLRSNNDFAYHNPHYWTVQYPFLVSTPLWSPLKFAHLRVSHPSLTSGQLPPYSNVPAIRFLRHLSGTTDRYIDHTFNQWVHRQCPVVVNAPGHPATASYDLTWASVPAQSPVVLTFDNMDTDWIQIGSHLTLNLDPLGGLPNLSVKVNGMQLAGPVTTASLATQPATAYAVSGSVLQVRLVSTGQRDAIEVNW
jgi:hypothetical protein